MEATGVSPKATGILIKDYLDAGLVPQVLGSPGLGKALGADELVLTPTGFKPIKDIKPGDYVTSPSGFPVKVLYQVHQGMRPLVRVTFRSGTSVVCDKEHLWTVKNRRKGSPWQTITTEELGKRALTTREPDSRTKNLGSVHRYNYRTPSVGEVYFEKVDDPELPAFTLGCLLGDGGLTSSSIRITNSNITGVLDRMKLELNSIGFDIEIEDKNFYPEKHCYSMSVIKTTSDITFKEYLMAHNIDLVKSIHKHIPKSYLNASLEYRQGLFMGLNATDGCWDNGHLVSFDTSSKDLHEDYNYLSRSLGMTISTSSRIPHYINDHDEEVYCNRSYRSFHIKNRGFNSIKSIHDVGEGEAICIKVDSEDGLFVTNGFNVTHNSDVVKQIAKDRNLVLIDIRLSQLDPVDLNGYPFREDNRATFLPSKLFPLQGMDEVPEGKDGWIIFLDELTSASRAVQAAAYKLILDREVGEHSLHNKSYIVAAGNKDTDKAITVPQSSAIKTRMAHIFIKPNAEEWIEWAYQNNIHPIVIAYINFRPNQIYDFNGLSQFTFSNPRTLHFLSNYMQTVKEASVSGIQGIVGMTTGTEFHAFQKVSGDIPNFFEIIRNPDTTPIPKSKEIMFSLVASVIDYLVTEGMDDLSAIITYIKRLPPEFQPLFFKNATASSLYPAIHNHSDFRAWGKEISKRIF